MIRAPAAYRLDARASVECMLLDALKAGHRDQVFCVVDSALPQTPTRNRRPTLLTPRRDTLRVRLCSGRLNNDATVGKNYRVAPLRASS